MKRILLLFFILLPLFAIAQLNVKVGYTGGITNPKVVNNIMSQWNAARPWLDEEMKALRYNSGLQLGLRQRLGPVGVEFTWHNRFFTFDAEGIDPATDQRFFQDVFFRYNSFSLGFENYIRNFGYGASIDGNFARYKTEATGFDDRRRIGDSEFGLSSHFHISINVESNRALTLSLKPYIQVPWSRLNVLPLQETLLPGEPAEPADFTEDYLNFGIMLVFYNGQW